jgi:hypothetical protein
LVAEWDAHSLLPSETDIEVMREIGGTESDLYGNGEGEFKFPCRVNWTNGGSSDPCVIIVTKQPPLSEWQHRTGLFAEVASVEPSGYALPPDVRVATYNAPEVSMGFCPVRLKSPSGAPFVINGPCDVFWHGDLKGCQISLDASVMRHRDNTSIINTPIDAISFVYCDWFDGCEDLALAGDWTPGRAWLRPDDDRRERSGRIVNLLKRFFLPPLTRKP